MYWFAMAGARMRRARRAPASSRPTRSAAAPTARSCERALGGDLRIFDAWDDEEWILDGAAVRVSLVCLDWEETETLPRIDGVEVEEIYSDLTARSAVASAVDLSNRTA